MLVSGVTDRPGWTWRFRSVVLLITLGWVGLTCQVLWLQTGGPERWSQQAQQQRTRQFLKAPKRGRILDRNGRVLVDHQPRFLLRRQHGSGELPPALRASLEEKTVSLLESGRSVPLPLGLLGRGTELCNQWPQLELQEVSARSYPHGTLASHLCGYVREEVLAQDEVELTRTVGVEGVEAAFDQSLRGKEGLQTVLMSATGVPLGLLSQRLPEDGQDLRLSLDLELQLTAERALDAAARWLESQPDRRASAPSVALMMDLKSGELLVMAVRPAFSPALFLKADEGLRQLLQDPGAPLMNRAIAGLYPPASTFKLVTAAAVLRHHPEWAKESFYCSGSQRYGETTFHCFQTSGHGSLSFERALALSCDSVFYELATRLSIEELRGVAWELGLGQSTGLGLPGEEAGLLPGPEYVKGREGRAWFKGDSANLGIGQGYLLVTPLQLLTAVGRLLTGSELKPRLLPAEQNTAPGAPPAALGPLLEGAKMAVQFGTARSASLEGATVAGKTGTAEAPTTSDNPKGLNHTWFVGWTPAERPEVVALCLFEGSGGYGGEVAAPVVKQMFDKWRKNSQLEEIISKKSKN